jgi:hypothetical protein
LHVVLGSAVVGAELELGRAAACGIGGFERGGFFYDTTLHAGPTRNDQSQRIVGVAAAGPGRSREGICATGFDCGQKAIIVYEMYEMYEMYETARRLPFALGSGLRTRLPRMKASAAQAA